MPEETDRSKRRAETARHHDDSELIEAAEEGTEQQGRAGGGLARKVGTRDERKRADKPDDHTRVLKSEEKGHKDTSPNERPGSV